MKEIFKKFASKVNVNVDNIYFLYDGQVINNDLILEEQITKIDKERKRMDIIVNNLNEVDNSKESKNIISKDVICPKCLETCRINIDDYKITLYDCKKGHKSNKILLNE